MDTDGIVEAGKRVLVGLERGVVKLSCPTCARFLAKVLAYPAFLDLRCPRCTSDVIILVGRDGSIMAVKKERSGIASGSRTP